MDLGPDTTGRQDDPLGWQPADLGSCVAGLVNALAKGTVDLMAPHGLIPPEFPLLRLFLGSEQWTVTQLAQAPPVKISRISRVAAKLVAMGPMSRRRLPADHRVVSLTPTGKGKTLTLYIKRTMHDYEAVISRGVSETETAVFAALISPPPPDFPGRIASQPRQAPSLANPGAVPPTCGDAP